MKVRITVKTESVTAKIAYKGTIALQILDSAPGSEGTHDFTFEIEHPFDDNLFHHVIRKGNRVVLEITGPLSEAMIKALPEAQQFMLFLVGEVITDEVLIIQERGETESLEKLGPMLEMFGASVLCGSEASVGCDIPKECEQLILDICASEPVPAQ